MKCIAYTGKEVVGGGICAANGDLAEFRIGDGAEPLIGLPLDRQDLRQGIDIDMPFLGQRQGMVLRLKIWKPSSFSCRAMAALRAG